MFTALDSCREYSIWDAIKLATDQKDELADSMINPAVLEILALTVRKEMTVNDLASFLGIPLTTCYKLVERMTKLGILAETGYVRTSARGRAATYTATVKSVSIQAGNGKVAMDVTWKNGQADTIVLR
ncbi:MAG: winged helix-turn-helix transcriptional regulator [Methanomassiliicoccales archaeon]|nr:winged helix-turn-helix transcriptional regulator [Methanomassiliicoccales archaeon]NYT15136.1 winged helix-turn-helix transcriptional regulator [Methanomassiliicoccales archaeon]HUV23860.1 winged helix-turn-helix domain-containing protein [Methanomassiliicoccales archaeon]